LKFILHEYNTHYNAVGRMFEYLRQDLKDIIHPSVAKENPIIKEGCLWFDLHASKYNTKKPHMAVWFLYKWRERTRIFRYVEIAINAENKPANMVIRRKSRKQEFWTLLGDLSKYGIRVFRKNIFINSKGYLYPINSNNYEWEKEPVFSKKTDEVRENPDEVKNEFAECLNEFDPVNYKANNYIRGKPWCNNAIFAFNIFREYEYDLNDYKEWADGLNQLTDIYKYLLS